MVVENDMNVNKVICDILEISFKDVKIDRAMTYDAFVKKVRKADPRYDIILYDIDPDDPSGNEALATVLQESPELGRNTIVIYDTVEQSARSNVSRDLTFIVKPFSIDSLAEMIKKVSAG
jgi:DNA-binding NtrC family response regulator